MADFIESEAEESEEEEELTEKDRRKLKKLKAASDSDEEEEDDEEKLQEELKDLIDDNPIEEEESSSSSESEDKDTSGKKRKRHDDDELDDRLSDEDFDLIEENLGIKVKRKKTLRRIKRIDDDDSDEEAQEKGKDAIANELFEGSDGEEERRGRRENIRRDEDEEEGEKYSDEEEEDEEDIGDFIVDADGQPIHGKRKKRRAIYTDAALQEAQDIFGVDFDYEDFNQEGEEYEDEDEEEYEDEDGVRRTRKKTEKTKKKSQRKTIYDVYEPSELERGHFTDFDEQIRKTDIPERMQLRSVPILTVEEGSPELKQEADWIYKHAFCKSTISNQETLGGRDRASKGPQAIEKIRKALEFMRNQHFEVPFIAFYRKEYVQPELTINDLWRVYKYDEKWTQLQTRKKNMMRLFSKMQKYQSEKLTQNVNESIPENVRILKDEDLDRLRSVQSLEELSDVYNHFILYYGNDVPAMQEASRQKEKEEARERRSAARRRQNEDGEPMDVDDFGGDLPEAEDELDAMDEDSTIKQAKRSDLYSLCTRAGLDGLVRKYGLSPEQFAENMRDNYQRHEVEQYPTEPTEVAMEHVSQKFPSASEVLKASNYMMAVQIAKEPLVRQCVREAFYERARIDITPTKQGVKEIDENHTLYSMKFIKDKPVRDLSDEQFLRLSIGEQDKLITVNFNTNIEGATSPSYADEIKQLFQRDEFSRLVQDWNDLRNQVIDIALNKFIFPALVKEMKAKLLNEAREYVLKACCHQLYNWLKVSPYRVDFADEEDEWDTKNGIRVMALSYVADLDQAAFGCLVNVDGEVTDHIRLEHILKRKNAFHERDRVSKEKDLRMLRNFIYKKKPHVIAVSGESREAMMLIEDLREITKQLVEDEQWPSINVELVDNHLAKVFANSTRAENEFREYPHLLREAISLARLLQDPLIEFSQLCNSDDEILCLKYHPMQDQLSKEELLEGLQLEFVNRTNEVGVDINRAINFPHTANLVQFICGLGPRKGAALLKVLKQTNQRLENRTQLVTSCHMGPKVFVNCAGFIKIDTNSLGDSTESYVEVLDGSRVHPETYEWARKMAVDALEYDDEDANPAGAVEEILEAPERLKDLDLDAFADELERQGYGNKRITLYDIRSELNHRYKDARASYQTPSPEEVFNMLTKETPQTFYIGKLVMATVTGFQHRKPQREELDRANPNRNEATGLWQCPFCMQNDFTDLSEVWNHFDAGSCPGKAVGIRIRLENGLSGFIPLKSLSDSEVTNPEQRVRPGQTIHCRITKIEVERFSVTATSRSSDLMDKIGEWRPPKDPYYDSHAEEGILKAEEEAKKLKTRQSYTRRVIVHPSFKNISFKEAEKLMTGMEQGEVIVRPSSKGTNHLTVTWKVGEGICQHVDVREEGKENAFSLGQSLWINDEEFEDLDEIIARYINPMAGHARDLYNFRYFRELGIPEEAWAPGKEREKAEEIIKDDKKKNPSKIHYFVSASREFPGKFMLTYLPRAHAKHEFITVTPEGFRFRGQVHDSLASLFKWFKEHFRDPIPSTPSSRGAQASSSSRTPGYGGAGTTGPTGTTPNVNPETLQRVAQTIPSHMLQSLSQAAHFQGTPTPFGYPPNTPYTPSGQTPFMTPYAATPHQPQTPRYSATPAQPPSAPGQGVFRTPATPGAPRGYGAQSHSSPFSRPSGPSSKPTAPETAADWGLSASDAWGTPGNEPRSTSRSAAPAGTEPDDWNAATNAWATSTRAKSSSTSSRPGSSRSGDDWGSKSNSWGSTNPRGRNTPGSQSKSGSNLTPAADDWGIPEESSSAPASSAPNAWSSGSSTSKPTTPRAPRATGSADDWGLSKDDVWGTSDSGNASAKDPWATADSGKSDDWGGSSNSNSNAWSSSSSSAPRGGGGGKRNCFKCNQEGHISRDCPNAGSSGRSNPRPRSDTPSSSQPAAVDDWGIPDEPSAASSAPAPGNAWDVEDTTTSKKNTNSWGAPKDSSSDSWGSKKDSASDSWGSKKDSWGSSSGGSGPRGAKGGSGGRACFKCNQEGHISRDCPNPSSVSSGGRTCYRCNQEGHIGRDCPNSSSSGGGGASAGAGGGPRTCYKCNQEGHISRDCPNPGSGRPSSRSRGSGAGSSNDDWSAKSSSSSSPWATGANATPRGASGRSTPSASKANDDWGIGASDAWGSSSTKSSNDRTRSSNQNTTSDDWGLSSTDAWGSSSSKSSNDRSKSSSQTAAADDWGSSSSKSANDRSRPASQSAVADDWGISSSDAWGASDKKNNSDRSRITKQTPSAVSDEVWDTGDTPSANVHGPADDPWGVSSAPGTASGQKSFGDATPLYDE